MLKSELLELIANGESSYLEFKRDDVRPEHLAKEIVALVNHLGGRVLLGVDDDGSISGIQRPNLELWVMDTVFARYIHPWILPSYEEVGALQNAMTVEKMLAGQRSARNSIIVDVLRDYGYVDARGMGVRRKIVPLVRAASGSEPRFEATEDHLTVVLPRARESSE